MGFERRQINRLLKNASTEIRDLRRALAFFEDQKVARGMEKVSDGVTHRPVFLIRSLLRQLPAYYVTDGGMKFGALMPAAQFCQIMAASYVSRRDLRLTPARAAKARNFQKCYQRLIAAAGPYEQVLATIVERTAVINHAHRMTGDGLIWIVEQLLKTKDKIARDELQAAMDAFIESQVLIPGLWRPISGDELVGNSLKARLLRAIWKRAKRRSDPRLVRSNLPGLVVVRAPRPLYRCRYPMIAKVGGRASTQCAPVAG
jgi:hypothetical protein